MRMRTLVTIALLGSMLAVLPARAEPAPVVYAHRGGAGLAPENTLGAFRRAHSMFGARGVWLEMDTQPASDGELVIIHDATLDRTSTNCTGLVMEKTSAELALCDQRKGWPDWAPLEGIPTARAVLTEGRDAGWRIMIELKNIPGEANFDATGEQAASALAALIAETEFPAERLMVQSFFPTSLDYIEAHAPGVATVMLTTSQLPGAPAGVGFPATANAGFSAARGYEVAAPDFASADLSAETVAAMRKLGPAVVVWTPDETEDIGRALDWGVDGVISNYPDRVYAALE